MADTGSERVIGIVPVSGHLDLKALAAAVGAKKAAMADHDVAQRESGYVLGGISPFGQRTRHRTVLDESALNFDSILVSGASADSMSGNQPCTDLLAVLHATRCNRFHRHVVRSNAAAQASVNNLHHHAAPLSDELPSAVRL
jgi:Cys-tRNA(Pro)/Cys-tRNA(Cys) deacylase